MIVTGIAILLVSGAIGLVSGRTYRAHSEDLQTTVQGNFATTEHNVLPVIGEGELIARYELPIRNWWDEPLTIHQVIPSCSCSKAEVAANTLPPQGRTTLTIEVKLPPTGGKREISCVLAAETGHRLVHRFTVVGYPHVQLIQDDESGAVSCGKVSPGQEMEVTRTLYLHAPLEAGKPPEIVAVHSSSESVTAWVDPVSVIDQLPGAAGVRGVTTLHIRLRPGAEPGRHGADLTIGYRHGGVVGSRSILVIWDVERVFSLDPRRIFISAGEFESPAMEWVVRVSHNRGQPFRVISVASDVPWLRILNHTEGRSPTHFIYLKIQPHSTVGKAFTDLEIGTDHPSQANIRLPIALDRPRTLTEVHSN